MGSSCVIRNQIHATRRIARKVAFVGVLQDDCAELWFTNIYCRGGRIYLRAKSPWHDTGELVKPDSIHVALVVAAYWTSRKGMINRSQGHLAHSVKGRQGNTQTNAERQQQQPSKPPCVPRFGMLWSPPSRLAKPTSIRDRVPTILPIHSIVTVKGSLLENVLTSWILRWHTAIIPYRKSALSHKTKTKTAAVGLLRRPQSQSALKYDCPARGRTNSDHVRIW